MSNRNNADAVSNWQDEQDRAQQRARLYQEKQDKHDKLHQDRLDQRQLEHDRRLHQYDHLIPPMKKVLGFTAKMTWKVMKLLVKTAIRIPGAVARLASKHDTRGAGYDAKNSGRDSKRSGRDPNGPSISFRS